MFKFIFFLYRTCNKHYTRYGKTIFVRILGRFYIELLSLFYSAYIPYTATIGEGVRFIHKFHGIFISKEAIIGNRCTIHHHVTIGSSKSPEYDWGDGLRSSPIIGNDVYIGANVCIIGDCHIGKNCIVGAGTSIANSDIPENSLVVPQKWRIINRNKEA